MAAVSATSARANLYRLIDQVNEESEPLTITGQRGNAVLVGEEDWRAIQETLFLESVPGLAKSIRRARGGDRGRLDRARLVSGWTLVYSRLTQQDASELASAGLKPKAQHLLDVVAEDPFVAPPRCERSAASQAATRDASTSSTASSTR